MLTTAVQLIEVQVSKKINNLNKFYF